MKFLGEQKAIQRLSGVKADLKNEVTATYEHKAKSCLTCDTPGACCLDAHFVNVHISKLEAKAIVQFIRSLPRDRRDKINDRIDHSIKKYSLTSSGDTYTKTYACPMFERGVGCLVHNTGKPVPCIMHACYENRSDLPPDELQTTAEQQIDDLNKAVYGRSNTWLPLPLALRALDAKPDGAK
jgi:hypothetical protein